MTQFLILTLTVVISYFCGCINGAIVTSKYIFNKDIRNFGSGNPGLTNFHRVFGKKGVAMLLAIDALKAALPVYFAGFAARMLGIDVEGTRACALFFVMLGHSYPMFHKFKGGKTVLCAGVGVWLVDWRVGIVCWSAFLIVLLITRLVSLGSIVSGVCYPLSAIIIGTCGEDWMYVFIVASAVLLVIRHRGNIQRLLAGTESRIYFKPQ